MKKMIKPLLLAATAIMLVVATVFATMAYMTSTATVTNVFTVGDVKLHMYESKVDKFGVKEAVQPDNNGIPGTDANSYHLLPGKTYLKDPTIYVDGNSESSYLFVRLRNDLKHIEWENVNKQSTTVPADPSDPAQPVDGEGGQTNQAAAIPEKHDSIVTQMKKKGWLEIWRAETNIDAVFVYVGVDTSDFAAKIDKNDPAKDTEAEVFFSSVNETTNQPYKAMTVGGIADRQKIPVFEYFTLANEIPNLPIFAGASVVIRAYAIQSSLTGFDTPEAIGSAGAVNAAWEYIRNELPFVD